MDEKARETLTKYLGDMHALESHGLQSVERQVDQLKDAGHPEAYRLVQEFKRTLESHVAALDTRLKALGGSPTHPVKEVASAVLGVAAGLYNSVRTAEASKSIRDDYTFVSLTAISYLMLHTTAKGLSDTETASLAEQHYRDAARLAMEVDRVMPGLVVQELKQDGLPMIDPSQESRTMVHNAWQRQASTAGL